MYPDKYSLIRVKEQATPRELSASYLTINNGLVLPGTDLEYLDVYGMGLCLRLLKSNNELFEVLTYRMGSLWH